MIELSPIMFGIKKILVVLWIILFTSPLLAREAGIAKANNIRIWYETFGDREDPALLLIPGAASQGILWPVWFCEQLVKEGFFVIRYDLRDSGESSYINFSKTPYHLRDLADDAIGLLDYLEIEKTHLLGISMGGPVAEIIASSYPERTLTLTLISTSPDFTPASQTFLGKPVQPGGLPTPKMEYVKWLYSLVIAPPRTTAQEIDRQVAGWRICSGNSTDADEAYLRAILPDFLYRQRDPKNLHNHYHAVNNSLALIKEVPYKITSPTLVIHGSHDPIFTPTHGETLADIIADSRYVLIDGMGHIPGGNHLDVILEEFLHHAAQ